MILAWPEYCQVYLRSLTLVTLAVRAKSGLGRGFGRRAPEPRRLLEGKDVEDVSQLDCADYKPG